MGHRNGKHLNNELFQGQNKGKVSDRFTLLYPMIFQDNFKIENRIKDFILQYLAKL